MIHLSPDSPEFTPRPSGGTLTLEMGSFDKIRSFAEAREKDEVPVRDGLTYGDCRALVRRVDALERDLAAARQRASSAERYLARLGLLEE